MELKKIIVTGGAGFIGSHTVVELVNAGYEPIIVDNFENSSPSVLDGLQKILQKEVKVYKTDCRDKAQLKEIFHKEKNIFGVIHFAANKAVGESSIDPLKYYDNNLQSLVVLLSVMKEMGVNRLVFSSSCTVYGIPSSDKLPVKENLETVRPNSPYGNTKRISEEIIEDFVYANSNFGSVILRYFNPIGAHPTSIIGELPIGVPNNLVPFITQTAAGLRNELTVFGKDYNTEDGTCIRDYIHVVDLAKAHVKSLNMFEKMNLLGKNEVFNLGTGKGNSVLEVIKTFEKISGLKLKYRFGDRRPGDVPVIYGDVNKANEILGWKAELSLEEAMRDSWNWQLSLGTKTSK
jgi:UDP-glucose 4-epimerase